MTLTVIGAGAFGTALAISLARTAKSVRLVARSRDVAETVQNSRENPRLPEVPLPAEITVTHGLNSIHAHGPLLLAVPVQALGPLIEEAGDLLVNRVLVVCCKGIDQHTMMGPAQGLVAAGYRQVAVLTGPSFAADIARGLPTALTLACTDRDLGERLQKQLSTPNLRLYRSEDITGAELGGALKNVIAIACGVAIGAGLGESARAALMTRGFAEMQRFAVSRGAFPETLMGLSGFGDLALTCTSEQSRNYRFGQAFGSGKQFDPTVTVEGTKTAVALDRIAEKEALDLPVCRAVAALVDGRAQVSEVLQQLLSRPLKEE